MPVGWMVPPGRTGRKVDAAPNQNIENNPMQSRKGSLARMLGSRKHFDSSGKSLALFQYRGIE